MSWGRSLRSARVGLVAGLVGAVLMCSVSTGARAEPVGDRWLPAPGQAFNDGWKPLGNGATYLPCQTVRWSFDRSGEAPERNTMIDDVRIGLAQLQPLTGLNFVEVAAGEPVDLKFRWGNLASEGHAGASGYGGFSGYGNGFVVFDNAEDWTLNKWSGWDWRRFEWPRPDLGPGWYSWSEGPGRVALAIHEVMHAIGFGHVEDFTSIMYPQGGIPNNQGKLSSGDVAGLRAMYLDRPCTRESITPTSASTTLATAPANASGAVRLKRVANGSEILASTVRPDGNFSVSMRTRLPKGSIATIQVDDRDSGDTDVFIRRVRSGGVITFSARVPPSGDLKLLDSRKRVLAMWESSP